MRPPVVRRARGARSSYVKFTDEIEQTLSSQRHLDKLTVPVIVAYGTVETPEFQRQSRDFTAALKTAGKPVELLVAEGYNHFEIPETLWVGLCWRRLAWPHDDETTSSTILPN